ncbi:DUF459 domain-containing protein [Brucella pituitosa]|uniref:SGNH/GDSL hydrolase family protein n=1 Tax=Brucella pituitosa TaxID=571256 RepID=UPI000C2759FB|nr:DUF459 domain-containing protein [Brucella pituitosa]MCK4207226.1 DUF459 domain-containing protein [Brucella pituitosa]PJO49258.1 DUF459 domain-containing protein [Brucella pituitosa]PRA84202.1 hypothetical protein CQ054_17420 [Ochrobactrum sp. MYb29]
MQASQFKSKASGVLMTMLVAFAMMLTAMSSASAQERPRTLFDLLFGSKQAQPQRQYEQPKPKRTRPAKPKRTAKPVNAAARSASIPDIKPEVNFVEKNPDAKKVLVVGDFIGNGLAEGLDVAFAPSAGIRIVSRINGSSGFVRDDHFDWPANIGKILDEEKPAAVVVMIGSNDRQAITAKGQSLAARSPEWTAEYQSRVSKFMKEITDKNYPLIWVGQPPFRPRGMSQDMLALNEIYRSTSEKAGAKFVDVWDGFVDEEGNFSQTGFDINGQTARLRGNDGINTTSAGKRKLAFYAEKPLKALFGDVRDNEQLLPTAGKQDPLKPVDRIAPVSLRDIDRDDSGVLLGGALASRKKDDKKPSNEQKPTHGRADDFSWPPKNVNP